MKWFNILFLLILLSSCSQKKYHPAEDALDAAREFNDGCLRGDFDKAKFYAIDNNETKNELNKTEKEYNSKTSRQQKELKEASIIIQSNKEILQQHSQIILSNSVDKKLDTLNLVLQNNLWLVDFQSSK